MRLRLIALLLLLAALPASGGEHRIAVSATILARCEAVAAAIRCNPAAGGAPVAYRTLAASAGVVTVEF
jgi:hypothetical protein